jgi:hypothetical protein
MIVRSIPFAQFVRHARRGTLAIGCGLVATRIKTGLKVLLRDIYDVYQDYPLLSLEGEGADFSVHVRPVHWSRRWFRPSYQAIADKPGPFAPLPSDIAFVGFEMSQNWQIASTQNRHLIFHAASVVGPKGGAILMPGLSGSGKSTLGAAMGFRRWRFLGDEFALFDSQGGSFQPMPRPISLKNQSIEVMKAWVPEGGFSRAFLNTPKGTMTYLRPPAVALEPLYAPASLSLAIFPRYKAGAKQVAQRLRGAEAAIELTNACVNYDRVGKPAFDQIIHWAKTVPVYRIEYPSLEAAIDLVSGLYDAHLKDAA